MHRRAVLKGSAAALAFGVLPGALAGCARDGAARAAASDPTWSWQAASAFLVPGDDQRVVFALVDEDNEPIADADLEAYVLAADDEVLGGPYAVSYDPEGATGRGLYVARVDLPEGHEILQVAAVEGRDAGKHAFHVPHHADTVPKPGEQAVSVATPTPDDDAAVSELCTAEPDCGMHEASLDDLLAEGRPVMALFATPAYCQTAVCGPAVESLDALRQSRDWGDVAFVHCEIFASPPGGDGEPEMAEPVAAWNLPTEPWLFAIDAGGTVIDRLDGAVLASEAEAMAERLAG